MKEGENEGFRVKTTARVKESCKHKNQLANMTDEQPEVTKLRMLNTRIGNVTK